MHDELNTGGSIKTREIALLPYVSMFFAKGDCSFPYKKHQGANYRAQISGLPDQENNDMDLRAEQFRANTELSME